MVLFVLPLRQVLRLAWCNIKECGSRALAEAFALATSGVEVLDLSGNPVGDPNPTATPSAPADGDAGIVCWFDACLKNSS